MTRKQIHDSYRVFAEYGNITALDTSTTIVGTAYELQGGIHRNVRSVGCNVSPERAREYAERILAMADYISDADPLSLPMPEWAKEREREQA